MLGLGKVRGSKKRNSSLSEENTDFYFLRLLLEGKIQGRVFEIFFLKEKKKYFLKNSETRLPKREQPLSLLLAQWHPWGSQPMLRQSSASLGTENKC